VSNPSLPVFGVPEGDPAAPDPKRYAFEHLPDLWDLLPASERGAGGGWPGVVYAIVCTHNAKRARDSGLRPIRGAEFFSIHGPRGEAAVLLMGHGEPIPGASADAGARELLYDGEIGTLTGHTPHEDTALWFSEQAAPTPEEAPPSGEIHVTSSGAIAATAPAQQDRGIPEHPQREDREGAPGRPGAHKPASRG